MAVDAFMMAVLVIIYLAITLLIGYAGYKKTKTTDDYLVAGRSSHPFIIALSYGATFISTSAIVGFGGQAANLGMGLIWLTVLNIGLGILIAFVFFGKKTREIGQRLSAVTFPDLMCKVYRSPLLQYISGFIIVISMPLYTAAILIGGARFIEPTLGISYTSSLLIFAFITAVYVIFGGLIAVMYTDAFQGAIMFIGMSVLLVLTYILVGGVTAGNTALSNMADLVPKALAGQGMTGWTSMPLLGSPIWYTLVTTIVLGVGIGVLAQPQLVVRFMTAKDNRSLNRAVLIGGIFILMMTGVAFTVGALSNVYFFQHGGQIAIDAAGGNVDSIIPVFINDAMPDIFVALFMLTLLAAAMSTLSSLYHAMGTALICDLWGRGRECALSLRNNQYRHHPDDGSLDPTCIRAPHIHHRPGNGDVHGAVCCCVPPCIRSRDLRETAIHPGRNREHGLRGSDLVCVDGVYSHGRGKTARALPGDLRHAGAPAPPVVGDRPAGDRPARLACGDVRSPETV